jgi:chromate reductase
MTYKVGCLIGSLAKAPIHRKLAIALVRLAPRELEMMEIPSRICRFCNRASATRRR